MVDGVGLGWVRGGSGVDGVGDGEVWYGMVVVGFLVWVGSWQMVGGESVVSGV